MPIESLTRESAEKQLYDHCYCNCNKCFRARNFIASAKVNGPVPELKLDEKTFKYKVEVDSWWVYKEFASDDTPPDTVLVQAGRINPNGDVRDGNGVWWPSEHWHRELVPVNKPVLTSEYKYPLLHAIDEVCKKLGM